MLAEIDLLEDNPANAAVECRTALGILSEYPCPLAEWKVLVTARQAALVCRDSDEAERALSKARECVAVLAASIRDPQLQQKFTSRAVSAIQNHRSQRA